MKRKAKAARLFTKKAIIVQRVMETADKYGNLTMRDVDKAIEELVSRTPLKDIARETRGYVESLNV